MKLQWCCPLTFTCKNNLIKANRVSSYNIPNLDAILQAYEFHEEAGAPHKGEVGSFLIILPDSVGVVNITYSLALIEPVIEMEKAVQRL